MKDRTDEHCNRLTYARPGLPARMASIKALRAIAALRKLVEAQGPDGYFDMLTLKKLLGPK